MIDDLAARGKAMRPWLGVSIITVTPFHASQYGLSATEGALVAQVVSDMPADHAGLKSGDVIVGIDGEKITTADEVVQEINGHEIGD